MQFITYACLCIYEGFCEQKPVIFISFCRKKKGKSDKNRPISNEAAAPAEEQQPVKEQLSEAERLLMQRWLPALVTWLF